MGEDMDFPEETSPKGSWDESTFFEIKLYCVDFQLSPSNPSHPDFFPFPGDAGDAESSDDEFGSESAAGEEEQAEMLKAVKFPEVEEKSKLPSLAPKVAKCLQKRSKAVQDLLGKFSAEKLTDVQQGFPGRTCISFLTLVFEQQNKTHFFSGFIPPKKWTRMNKISGWRIGWGLQWRVLLRRKSLSWPSIRKESRNHSPRSHWTYD